MRLKVLGSGSSGNCYILENENEALIIEAGLPFMEVKKAVKALQICRDTKMKQQPRKVATRYARKEFYCPACKKHIRDIYRNKGRYSFCDVCGQKIDWR